MCHAYWKGKVATICWKSPNNLANVLEASSHVPSQGSKFKEKCSRIFATSWEKLVPKHKLILKIMDRRLPVMMTSQIFLARTNPDFDRSNNEYYIFFWPLQYRIALAIDCCTALTFRFLAASWWKIHSHIFEFLSRVFTRFHVLLYMPWVSSYGGVWSLIRFIPYLHIFETWAFSLLGKWSKSLLHKEKKLCLLFSAKKLIWREICSTNSVFIIRSQ